MLRSLRFGVRRLLNKDRAERDLSDEVQHYLEMAAAEHMRRGLSREEAVRAARIEFGGVEAVKEQIRTGGWEAAVESVWRDIRYAWRGMSRNPLFALIVVTTLALGIGANTAMFSVFNAVMLRPLPYHDSSRLMLLWTDDIKRGLHQENTAYATIADWQRENGTFDEIAYFNTARATLGQGETRQRTRTAFASSNLFHLLGIPALKGRWFTPDDERETTPVAVISYRLWQQRFAGNPDIVGESLLLDDWQGKGDTNTLEIVGVMPQGFYFPDKQTDIWTIASTTYWRWARESTERFPSWARQWTAIGRLRSGSDISDARDDLARIGERLAQTYRSDIADFPGFAVNIVPLLDDVTGVKLQHALWLLMGAVGLVLLVACANVANLLLARGSARQQEFALRRALGATPLRLIRQQFIESLTLAAFAGMAGVLLAAALVRLLGVTAAQRLPRFDEAAAIDMRVLAFGVGASIASAVVFGLLPAIRVTSADRFRMARFRGVIVLAECSVAVVLLVAAGLLLRSLAHVRSVDPGFDVTQVLVARVEFPRERLTAADVSRSEAVRAASRERAQQTLLETVARLPDIEAAGFVDDMFVASQGNESITFPGDDQTGVAAGELHAAAATGEYFSVFHVPLRLGRYLRRDDVFTKIQALWTPLDKNLSLAEKARRAVPEPVVVNEAFVRRFLKGKNPIGERFCVDPTGKTYCYEIVGVVGDMHRGGPERPVIPEYYGPFLSAGSARADLVVRTRSNPLTAAASVRAAIVSVLPGALVPSLRPAAFDFADFTAQRSLETWLLTGFAVLALLLAGIGIYGMVHFAVAQRTREIGVRIAIGARPRDVLTNVIADGMRLPLIGFAVGLAVAFVVTRVMSHFLFGVAASDPLTYALVAATLVITAIVACYVPARRAENIDVVVALRVE
jgi:putative ABC transport system permease protein